MSNRLLSLNLHIIAVTPNGEREAAWNLSVFGAGNGRLEGAAGQDSFLRAIKSNCSKLFPVAHQRYLDYNLVYRKFSLIE